MTKEQLTQFVDEIDEEVKESTEYKYQFLRPIYSENTEGQEFIKDFAINKYEFTKALIRLGFYRYDMAGVSQIIRIVNNVAQLVETREIIDTFEDFILNMPADADFYKLRYKILEKIYNVQVTLFSKEMMYRLRAPAPLVFNEDTEKTSYFYFKNGFVAVSAEGVKFHKYDEMPGFHYTVNDKQQYIRKLIWQNQILPRDYKKMDKKEFEKNDFNQFLYNVAGKKTPARAETLKILIGYLMHSYFGKKLKAVLLTDSIVSSTAEGRSGKTLIGRAIQKMMNANAESKSAYELNGKEWKFDSPFKYQNLDVNTNLAILNDVRPRFKFEWLYNDISDGLERQRKGEMPIKVNCKFLIPTNQTIDMGSGSSKDRVVEFELSDHYSHKYNPQQDFPRWFWGEEWTGDDWAGFDNTMIECSWLYLSKGLPTTIQSINLEKRKLIDGTNEDFIEFMTDLINGEHGTERQLIIHDEKSQEPNNFYLEKKQLYDLFRNTYPDHFKLTSTKFSIWLKKYAEFSGIITRIDTKRSGSIDRLYFWGPVAPPPDNDEDIPDFLKPEKK